MEGQANPPSKRIALSRAAVPGVAATVPGGTRDRLSRLPNRALLCILLELGTKHAIRTSALSRQWRHLWTQLPVLNFDGVKSSVPAKVLAAYKAHGEDDIHSLTVSPNKVNGQKTAAWMSLAVPLLSGRLHLDNRRTVTPETLQLFLAEEEGAVVPRDAFLLPCFKKATEISMDLGFLALALPPAGIFDALKVMLLEHFWFRRQLSISDAMFPSLEELTIRRGRGLVELTLKSESLLDIHLSVLPEFQRLNIIAPGLNKLEVMGCICDASIAAERLQVLRWEVDCIPELRKKPLLRVLRVPAICTRWSEYTCAGFLNSFPAVEDLELQISLGGQDLCLPNCICHEESGIRGAEVVPIRALERVEIINFYGGLREAYFVEQLVQRAPRLKLLRITSMVEVDSLDDIKGICPAECEFEIVGR